MCCETDSLAYSINKMLAIRGDEWTDNQKELLRHRIEENKLNGDQQRT